VAGRRIFGDGSYTYELVPGKKFSDYGLEQMGDIARDYFYLRHGMRVADSPYSLKDYAHLLPVR
jgi:hypothetical protein